MYDLILLAFDGTTEGGKALREGALLAKRCGARVYLLSVMPNYTGVSLPEGSHPAIVSRHQEGYLAVFELGMSRLRQLGLNPAGKLVSGEPTEQIAAVARQIGADLVVLGHRRQSFLERWWSGSRGAYLVDSVDCSILVGRKVIPDDAFEVELRSAN